MAPKAEGGSGGAAGERKSCVGLLFAEYIRQTKDAKGQVVAKEPKCYGLSWNVRSPDETKPRNPVSLPALSPWLRAPRGHGCRAKAFPRLLTRRRLFLIFSRVRLLTLLFRSSSLLLLSTD